METFPYVASKLPVNRKSTTSSYGRSHCGIPIGRKDHPLMSPEQKNYGCNASNNILAKRRFIIKKESGN
jgi:hypothetical protein